MSIFVRGLRKSYVDGAERREILHIPALRIPDGARAAVFGPSGVGKSTLLNLIAGLDRLDSGDIWWTWTSGGRSRVSVDNCSVRRLCGFVFQDASLLANHDLASNLALAGAIAGVDLDDSAIERLLQEHGLESYGGHLPHELSGGLRQRASLARAVAHGPNVLFADEPTGNVDPSGTEELLVRLREWQTELPARTVVLVSHDREVVLTHFRPDAILWLEGAPARIRVELLTDRFTADDFTDVSAVAGSSLEVEGPISSSIALRYARADLSSRAGNRFRVPALAIGAMLGLVTMFGLAQSSAAQRFVAGMERVLVADPYLNQLPLARQRRFTEEDEQRLPRVAGYGGRVACYGREESVRLRVWCPLGCAPDRGLRPSVIGHGVATDEPMAQIHLNSPEAARGFEQGALIMDADTASDFGVSEQVPLITVEYAAAGTWVMFPVIVSASPLPSGIDYLQHRDVLLATATRRFAPSDYASATSVPGARIESVEALLSRMGLGQVLGGGHAGGTVRISGARGQAYPQSLLSELSVQWTDMLHIPFSVNGPPIEVNAGKFGAMACYFDDYNQIPAFWRAVHRDDPALKQADGGEGSARIESVQATRAVAMALSGVARVASGVIMAIIGSIGALYVVAFKRGELGLLHALGLGLLDAIAAVLVLANGILATAVLVAAVACPLPLGVIQFVHAQDAAWIPLSERWLWFAPEDAIWIALGVLVVNVTAVGACVSVMGSPPSVNMRHPR